VSCLQDQETGLTKVQKFSHVDLQGRNLLTIPITLYHKAPEIISLNLSRNLSLNIPKDFIQQCVNLRKIEFTGNDAERLPNSIAAALRLTYLDISHNRLEDLEHAALEKHGALVALKLSNNRLASLPSAFGLFKSLRSLHLASNYLTTFPQFICDLVTLVELDISFNSIKSFPLQIGQLSALERLNATNNRLTGSLPQTFSMLGSLKELDLRFNLELQNIDVVAELPRLETVVVSHNRVSGFQQSFQKLRALHLNSNPVTRFSIPTVLVTLKFLNLSNAKIAAINDTLFDKLPNLERLILDKNHIVSFPPQIAKLRRLEYLSCNNNELATLPKEIGQLQDLRYLDLHYNNIKVLPGEIWQLTCLVTLNISSNVLKEFPKPPTNTTAVGITVSEAPANPEQTIPEDGIEGEGPETIRRPSQQTGNLLSVGTSPAQNGRKGSMVSIYGQGGRKASVISKSTSDVTVGGSPTVSTPRKDSSSSSRMSYTFVYTLKYLYLADNRLSDEVFEELSLLSELRVLNLSYNDLYDIPPRALSRMPQLNELYLSGNELTSLPAEDLEHIPSLKVLHLNGNKFQTLPAELGKIRKLLVLDVGNNALKYNISNWPYDWNWYKKPFLN
jgi:adenylate cyclase